MTSNNSVTFYTICNAPYFPGLVGLLNSLRFVGHDEPLVVGDCGLTAAQRKLLAPHCTLFELDSRYVKNPTQVKPFPFFLKPEGIVVFIDSDMIVTKRLDAALAAAAAGKISVFAAPDQQDRRWFATWQEIFELSSPPRHQTYAVASFIAFSTAYWPDLLPRWWKACERISTFPTVAEGVPNSAPYAQADQDAFNALLMSNAYPSDALSFQPFDQEVYPWQFNHLHSVDAGTLRCQYKGEQPSILHACLTPKQWMRRGVRRSVYMRFLRRLLNAPDVALSVPPSLLPIWLRPGIASDLAYNGLAFVNRTHPRRAVSLLRHIRARFSPPATAYE